METSNINNDFQYIPYLMDLFPNKTFNCIQKAVKIADRQLGGTSEEALLEHIIDLLTGNIAQLNEIARILGIEDDRQQAENLNDSFENDDELLDEAVGYIRSISEHELSTLFDQILTIFPDACPLYVRNLCYNKSKSSVSLDELIEEMTKKDYPKQEMDARDIYEHLQEVLPNADPSYLHRQADALVHQTQMAIKEFVDDALENEDYPTMEAYLKTQKEQDFVEKYTTKFDVQEFLKEFPDPEKFFSDEKRLPPLGSTDPSDEEKIKEDETYAQTFLHNYYCYLRKKDIDRVFSMYNKNLNKTCNRLDRLPRAFKTARKSVSVEAIPKNIQLLQEIAYLKYKKVIKRILKQNNEHYRLAKEDAARNGLLQTCQCCYDEELIPEECYFCIEGCIFCKDCVKGGAESRIGDGMLNFPCLSDCGAEFSISTLQMVLDSVVFSRMAQRRQIEEIKNANVIGLETCPFCEFATIPMPEDKIFRCLNEECKIESCRECRHKSHIPMRCNEIEYDEDVKMRTYIENKMTEALLRKCWKCAKVFIKESGCNKMTCSCGAQMCYICGQAVRDYRHFGSTGHCPLYTTDLNKFHAAAVMNGANVAKSELGVDRDTNKLKIDPTKDISQHYAGV